MRLTENAEEPRRRAGILMDGEFAVHWRATVVEPTLIPRPGINRRIDRLVRPGDIPGTLAKEYSNQESERRSEPSDSGPRFGNGNLRTGSRTNRRHDGFQITPARSNPQPVHIVDTMLAEASPPINLK
jgi:hypothetical protein